MFTQQPVDAVCAQNRQLTLYVHTRES